MTTIDALQWAACAASLLSTWLHGKVNRYGPALAVLTGLLFVAINALAGLWVVAGVSALSVVLNIRNLILWSKSA